MAAAGDYLLNALETQAISQPDKLAIIYKDTVVSYLDLNEQANQLAKHLKTLGEPIIGLLGDNKLEIVITEIACLKAGITFVPIDNDSPIERIDYILRQSGIKTIVNCHSSALSADKLEIITDKHLLLIKRRDCDLSTYSKEDLEATPESTPAYVLYTSGSTALVPKGVTQTHRGLKAQIDNYTRDLRITKDDTLLQLATPTHDQSIVDIYGAFANGATLALYDMDKTMDLSALRAFISKHEISIFSAIPSIFKLVFDGFLEAKSLKHLRIVTTGGEETKIEHAKLYQEVCPDTCIFINGYGATECSWISFFIVDKTVALDGLTELPLGELTTGLVMLLVKEEDERLYELCVGGRKLLA